MAKIFARICCALLAASITQAVRAVEPGSISGIASPAAGANSASIRQKAAEKLSGGSRAVQPSSGAKTGSNKQPSTCAFPEKASESEGKTTTASLLAGSYTNWRNHTDAASLSAVMQKFKQLLLESGAKLPAQTLIKANPVLLEMGAQAIDAGNGRAWCFNKMPDARELVLEWQDCKNVVSYVGKRHRVKKITTVTQRRAGELNLPADVTIAQARIIGSTAENRFAVLFGSENATNLWLGSFRPDEGGTWREEPGRLAAVPAFLTANMSGKVVVRGGADMIVNVAPVVKESAAGKVERLPEAQSSTYAFWLHLSDQGYTLMHHLPDEEQFEVVKLFLSELAANHTDAARALLLDGKLLSIPKYLGIKGGNDNYLVAQMSSPANLTWRFRLITLGGDDLIFEVARRNDKLLIKGIFIAAADPFLKEIAEHLPTYAQVGGAPDSSNL